MRISLVREIGQLGIAARRSPSHASSLFRSLNEHYVRTMRGFNEPLSHRESMNEVEMRD
jgi:hypothetical protein